MTMESTDMALTADRAMLLELAAFPRKALSIMQPWSWLIANGHKDIENRDWPTRYRGPVLIHAGKRLDRDAMEEIDTSRHPVTGEPISFHYGALYPRGGIVGVAEIVDCVEASASPWFVGRYGFVLQNARPLPFRPMNGALGFFPADYAALSQKDAPDGR